MELEHSFTIPVPPEQAWQVLLDVEQVAPCMPGATVDAVDGDQIKGRIKVKVGPVSLTYAGTARFTEQDEQARSVTLEASGKETRGSGTATATVHSTLQGEGDGRTRVVVHTTMSVTGRPAQFGRGVMAEVGGRIIERFATNLAAQLAGGSLPEASLATGNGAGPGAAAPGPAAASPAVASAAAHSAATDSAPAGHVAGTAPLEELNLPVRAYNSLRREGIHTVGDLSGRTEGELLAIENLGPQSVTQIKQRLADIGLGLAEPGQGSQAPPGAGTQEAGPAGASVGAAGAGDGTITAGTGDGTPGSRAGEVPGAARAWADGAGGTAAPRGARPPDEDAIDLLSVAGFPVLKRALPVLGVVVALLLVVFGIRRRGRASSG
jgi:carbon monoxide dehydrogenase subunit G